MYIVKVLKRKDASSVVVAIFIAMALGMWLPSAVGKLSGWISGLSDNQYYAYSAPGANWQAAYLQPAVFFLLQLIALEILLRIVIMVHPMFVRKRR